MVPGLKFAVVREDPLLEAALVEHTGARAVLTVASGGCTALTLRRRHPHVRVTAFDINPVQLAHVRHKADAAHRGELLALNADDDNPDGLNQCGAFEGLFRVLRQAVQEFVAGSKALANFFNGGPIDDTWFQSPYWPAAFHTAFNEPLLHAMFGPAATQHAPRGSYPGYFQRAFERGLRRADARSNPFLQHVFLGRYLRAPEYAHPGADLDVELLQGGLLDVPDLRQFQVLSLSNIFDWSDDTLVREWSLRLQRDVRPGTCILLRQLNNQRDLRRFLGDAFTWDEERSRRFLREDRSLFYERIEVGIRR